LVFDGTPYRAPAAGAGVGGGGRRGNAWYFWRVDGGASLNDLREQLLQ
jgi:hypothetical protein